ncbi:hypothetical protein BH10PSE7_BH10PSE7_33070 [soil metagenome]
MRRCIIHIGLHKTASTSLQRMIGENQAFLNANGFYVPEITTEEYRFGHHSLSFEFSDLRVRRNKAMLYTGLARELKQQGMPEQILLSSEDFSRRIHQPVFLNRLVKWMGHLGYGVNVAAYIRPQHTAIQAMYTQRLKMWGVDLTFEEFWPTIMAGTNYDYDRRFKRLLESSEIGARLFPFNSEVFAEGIHHHFLRNIGVPAQRLRELHIPEDRNIAPGPKTIAALMAISDLLKTAGITAKRDDVEWMVRLIRQMAKVKGWDAERYNALTPEIFAVIEEHYRASNESFAPRAFGRAWADVFAVELAGVPPVNVFRRENASAAERADFDEFTESAAEAIIRFRDGGDLFASEAVSLAS